jgi:dipeptidyl aminopeptidase/acylaminoacyl peptidase
MVGAVIAVWVVLAAGDAAMGQRQGRGRPDAGVYKARIAPHWFQDETRFWYRNDLPRGAKEFVVVDAQAGKRQTAFDHQRLAASLSKAMGREVSAERLPFDEIEFTDAAAALRFTAGDATWRCDLASYECTKAGSAASPAPPAREAQDGGSGAGRRPPLSRAAGPSPDARFGVPGTRSSRSPDGKWIASVRDHNVFVRSEADGKEVRLSEDGKDGMSYAMLEWSPDGKTLAGFRVEPGDDKQVHLVESSPPGGGRAVLRSRVYELPGDKFAAYELNLFDVAAGKQIKPKVERIDLGRPRLRWSRDGSRLAYQKDDRGHQRLRVIEVDARSGEARDVIDEKTTTFIWTAHTENLGLVPVNWLEKTNEMVYASERDGWRHLYLVDVAKGRIANQITRGEFVVRGIDRIDEDARQIWFNACGKNADQDPYFLHYYRVNFDGSGLVALTEGNGTHAVQLSPDRRWLIDTYSRVDAPPVHELRRTSDGALVCRLEEADVSELKSSGWEPPEVFVAKGRDGRTDIWGIICRPKGFDPNRKYPVVEQIYNGPQSAYVPKSFSGQRRFASLADLGFVVVQMDAMGTAHRSKAFHDVAWHNLKDAGLPDRIAWHKAAAAKYPWYDATRVGIYGNSAGGQNAAAAVLFHPEFYKAAVANSGCHDNRMDKASWNEQWMGYPVGPQYAESSNVDNAYRLRGRLMLIVGEMDTNVPPESTYRFVDALIKAGKDFEFVFVPGAGHGVGGQFYQRRMQDFFLRHLQGVEPPDRNAAAAGAKGSSAAVQ